MNKTMYKIVVVFLFLTGFAQSQSALQVRCKQLLSGNLFNEIKLDNNIIEYALCGSQPAFYVAVFDTNCTAWQTCFGGNPNCKDLGNYNFEGNFRQRPEYYFAFHQNSIQNLESLDSLINVGIPDDHAFVIYTPLSFDYAAINALHPGLGSTLTTNFGNQLVNAQMFVAFGVKGYPSSYVSDTTINNQEIVFTTTICPNSVQTASIENKEAINTFSVSPNPFSNAINITQSTKVNVKGVHLKNMLGEEIHSTYEFEKEDKLVLNSTDLPAGIYFVEILTSDEKQVVIKVMKM
ncbi:MAG: hypothetical protein RI922_2680 [Bacteroidota bacterium]|jgi:hypothetical protein